MIVLLRVATMKNEHPADRIMTPQGRVLRKITPQDRTLHGITSKDHSVHGMMPKDRSIHTQDLEKTISSALTDPHQYPDRIMHAKASNAVGAPNGLAACRIKGGLNACDPIHRQDNLSSRHLQGKEEEGLAAIAFHQVEEHMMLQPETDSPDSTHPKDRFLPNTLANKERVGAQAIS